jgi:hypothetical protein
MLAVQLSMRTQKPHIFSLMAESVQNRRHEWFYVKDVKVGLRKFGIPPFDASKVVKKLKPWDQALTDAKMKEMDLLVDQIRSCSIHQGEGIVGSSNHDPLSSNPHATFASQSLYSVELFWTQGPDKKF